MIVRYTAIISLVFLLIEAKPVVEEIFSHEKFDLLLQKNVKDGKIYYEGFNSQEFDNYLNSLETAMPQNWARDEQLAFWLNAYNAFVIKNVLSHPEMKSPIKVEGFFKKDKFEAAGKSLTLDQIEHEIIRPQFKEPLIHFGVVCAANGCPKLDNHAFRSASVIDQLKKSAKNYLNSKEGFILDKIEKIVYLSKIMEWFREDFGKNNDKLIEFILPYIKKEDADFINKNKNELEVEFIEYDWSLNSSASLP